MSLEAVSEYLSGENLTDSWKVYYDFNNYDGDYVINSVPDSSQFSGFIGGDSASFKNTQPGEGYFDQNYLEIIDGQQLLNTEKNFTILISQEKVDNSCGTLFSNYQGDRAPTSGWEFAINNANKLFFKNFQNWMPHISTFNNTPAHKNYYYIGCDGSNINFGRYIVDDEKWEHGGVDINSNYLLNSPGWYLGSGEYNYKGYIDQFFYFDEVIDYDVAEEVIAASEQGIQTGVGFLEGYVSGITGWNCVPSGTTGVIYTTGIVSGYVTGITAGNYLTGSGLTGAVESGDIYYEPLTTVTGATSGAGLTGTIEVYESYIATGDASSAGIITGFATGLSGFLFTGLVEPIHIVTGVTGVLSTGCTYEPIWGEPSGIIISGGETILTGDFNNQYRYNTISYLGERFVSGCQPCYQDWVEYIRTSDRENINRGTMVGYSELFKGSIYNLRQTGSPETVTVVSNGITQLTGEAYEYSVVSSLVSLNPFRTIVSTQDGNYFLTGTRALSPGMLDPVDGDEVMFDGNQRGIRSRLDIPDLAAYGGAPFSEIPMEGQQIFFNGQKIYSGVDYIDAGGFFPIGDITSMSGTYFCAPPYANSTINSGYNLYDLTSTQFSGNTNIMYVNGVRQSPDSFLTYSTGVSLLKTGKNIIEEGLPLIYNIRPGERIK